MSGTLTPRAWGGPHGFYGRTEDGGFACRLCEGRRGLHEPTCAVLAVRLHLQDLTGQLGLYVSTMRELVETVDRLLHGEDR